MATLFISDLHLEDSRPHSTEALLAFLRDTAAEADALYILGDLFEAWVGDDDPSQVGAEVAGALRRLVDGGVPVHFMHGNRDFLLGADYAARCGMQVLGDPTVIDLYDVPTLLGHGDLMCTDDVAYQEFRAQTRDPRWQAQFLAQRLPARLAFAEQARSASKARYGELRSAGTAETITDVNPQAVDAAFAEHRVQRIIHGHTHRPAIHEHPAGQRIVLGDWYTQGSVLRVTPAGVELQSLRGD